MITENLLGKRYSDSDMELFKEIAATYSSDINWEEIKANSKYVCLFDGHTFAAVRQKLVKMKQQINNPDAPKIRRIGPKKDIRTEQLVQDNCNVNFFHSNIFG